MFRSNEVFFFNLKQNGNGDGEVEKEYGKVNTKSDRKTKRLLREKNIK